MQNRNQIFSIYVGKQKSGKSHLARKAAEKFIAAGKKVLVIDNGSGEPIWEDLPYIEKSELRTFTGFKQILYNHTDKNFFLSFIGNFWGGLIIFDDGKFFMSNSKNESMMKFISTRRQHNADIFFLCHGITEIAPAFWTFANHLVLFPTRDNLDRRRNVIPEFELWEQRQAAVNKMNESKNPDAGQYYKPLIFNIK